MIRKYMSRKIMAVNDDGSEEIHSLAIAELCLDDAGKILAFNVSPFSGEIPGVEYLDTPLFLKKGVAPMQCGKKML